MKSQLHDLALELSELALGRSGNDPDVAILALARALGAACGMRYRALPSEVLAATMEASQAAGDAAEARSREAKAGPA
jgi:hypothetical protein